MRWFYGTQKMLPSYQNQETNRFEKEVIFMKGYTTASGYMGYVDGAYILFASEEDYLEYIED